jgi:general secretion pathway protein J
MFNSPDPIAAQFDDGRPCRPKDSDAFLAWASGSRGRCSDPPGPGTSTMRDITHPEKGFTLLEILVAILIFGVVMSSLFISFRSLMFEPEGIQQTLKQEEMARTALDRMTADLQAVHVPLPPVFRPPEINDPPDPHRLVGTVDFAVNREFGRLRFSSLAHLPMRNSGRRGVAQIVYYVQAIEDDTFVLRRADHLPPYPEPEALNQDPVLCENVHSLSFRFMDETGESQETWNSDDEAFDHATPAAVAIRLELGEAENPDVFETEVLLPVRRGNSG